MNNIANFKMMILALVIFLSVTASLAQQSPLSMQGGDQGFPRIAPTSPPKAGHMNPRMYPPSVNKGGPPAPTCCFPCPPPGCRSTNVEPSVYMGYLYANGVGFQIQSDAPKPTTTLALAATRDDLNIQGIWLELAATMDVCQNLGAVVSGAHLFCLQPNATQWYTIYNSTNPVARNWNPDVQWWEVNSAGTYRFCPGISGIVGFRWTSFIVNFNNARDQRGFSLPNVDTAKLTTNTYIPYSGLLFESNPDCQSTFKVAAYGCPVLPGTFAYKETMTLPSTITISPNVNLYSGYFVEALSEYSMRSDMWTLGGFVRFTAVHSERSVGVTLDGENTPMDFTLDRMNWIFGGKLGFMF